MRLFLSAVASLSFSLCSVVGCREAPRPDPGAVTTASGASSTSAPSKITVAAGEVALGKPPPDFTAKDHNGSELKLSALKGKPIVVYFYPKDETSGCTQEAKDFRDAWSGLQEKGAVVIGISTDKDGSHQAFAKHHSLPFHLVSDPNGEIAKAFGVPNRVGFLGRQTFVIGADGNMKKIYRDVDVSKHAAEVLADVKS